MHEDGVNLVLSKGTFLQQKQHRYDLNSSKFPIDAINRSLKASLAPPVIASVNESNPLQLQE